MNKAKEHTVVKTAPTTCGAFLKLNRLLLTIGIGATVVVTALPAFGAMEQEGTQNQGENLRMHASKPAWQAKALQRAAFLVDLKWTPAINQTEPVARRMPKRWTDGEFYEAVEQTGLNYSSTRFAGRRYMWDISLHTFYSALANPESVLYTRDLRLAPYNVQNSAAFFGIVCNEFVAYCYGLNTPFWTKGLCNRPGIAKIAEQSAQGVQLCDMLYKKGHVAMITGITKNEEGLITHVEISEATRKLNTARTSMTAAEFDEKLKSLQYTIYRIDDYDAFVGDFRPQLTPFFDEKLPVSVNKTLLLDMGDRANYCKGDTVQFNILDKNTTALVVQKNGALIEKFPISQTGVMPRTYHACGRYLAHCVMSDGSASVPVEFIVAEIVADLAEDSLKKNDPLTVKLTADNCKPLFVIIGNSMHSFAVTSAQIRDGTFRIPAGQIGAGKHEVLVIGETEFGQIYSNLEKIRID